MQKEKARRELHKNITSYFEQILVTTNQLYGHLPPITKTIQVRWIRKNAGEERKNS